MIPLMLVLFISNLDSTVVATAIPSIGRSLHDLAGAPWIATAYLLTSAVTTLVLGQRGDRYGRKPVFQFSIAVFLAGSALSGIASSMPWLVLFRDLQTVQHKSAFTAGLYVIPLLVGLVAATAVAGPVIARTGRYKVYPVIGAVFTGASMGGLSLAGADSGALPTLGLTAGHTVSAYQAVFTWTIPFMALALVLAVLMPEKPLSDEMIDVAAGKAEVPEY
jgi:MFS family permease